MKKYSYPEAKSLVICGDIHGDFEALVYDACDCLTTLSVFIVNSQNG